MSINLYCLRILTCFLMLISCFFLSACDPSGLSDQGQDMYRDASEEEVDILKTITGKIQVHCFECPGLPK